jgi:Ca2+-binding RTX toxin-like protein
MILLTGSGGAGNDGFVADGVFASFLGDEGDDLIVLGNEGGNAVGRAGEDTILGGAIGDTITTGSGGRFSSDLTGEQFAGFVDAGAGDDTVTSEGGSDTLIGGVGEDGL